MASEQLEHLISDKVQPLTLFFVRTGCCLSAIDEPKSVPLSLGTAYADGSWSHWLWQMPICESHFLQYKLTALGGRASSGSECEDIASAVLEDVC